MDMDSPEFRAHLHAAVADTSPPYTPRPACTLSADGWRYRREDPPRTGVPGWGPAEDGNWRWHHQQLALLDAFAGDTPMQVAIVDSWEPADPVYSWRDHTAALRLKRLVRLFGAAFDDLSPAFRVRLLGMIEEHCRRLLGDVARSHHNHALDQIYAVALARRYFPFLDIPADELLRRLAVERDHLIADGVVTENSPGYQSWIPARLSECHRLLTGHPDVALLAASAEFTNWIARPGGLWPEIGDTQPGKAVEGLSAPPEGLRVFQRAGYAVYRKPGIYVALKCGFLTNAHRHADDGGLLLDIDGREHFIEAGMFGYAEGWEREYARSPQAHSLSYRVGANLIRSTTSRRWQRQRARWGMKAIPGGVVCRSYMFDDATYTRSATFQGGAIELRDEFDLPGQMRTRFHVPDGVPVDIQPGSVSVGAAVMAHDLPDPRIVAGHRTIAYMRYGPAQVIEFEWPPDRTVARFTITTQSRLPP